MTIGEKIRKARRALGMTQATLAGDFVTRNMISRLESGDAMPSLDTLRYLSGQLGLPVSYFLEEDEDFDFYRKAHAIAPIREAFSAGRYDEVIAKTEALGIRDDELCYLLSLSYFYSGKESLRIGGMKKARRELEAALSFAEKTVYDTATVKLLAPVYLSVAKNFRAPLLELDRAAYMKAMPRLVDAEFFHYLTQDTDFSYDNDTYRRHLDAKQLLRQYRYQEALRQLSLIEQDKTPENYQVYVMYGVYTDMETCYKELSDFESAYRYASKRMSLLESFE